MVSHNRLPLAIRVQVDRAVTENTLLQARLVQSTIDPRQSTAILSRATRVFTFDCGHWAVIRSRRLFAYST